MPISSGHDRPAHPAADDILRLLADAHTAEFTIPSIGRDERIDRCRGIGQNGVHAEFHPLTGGLAHGAAAPTLSFDPVTGMSISRPSEAASVPVEPQPSHRRWTVRSGPPLDPALLARLTLENIVSTTSRQDHRPGRKALCGE